MSRDAIGTVRREDHGGSASVWVLAPHDPSAGPLWLRPGEPMWLCMESPLPGLVGKRCITEDSVLRDTTVIGAVPGTPAAEADLRGAR